MVQMNPEIKVLFDKNIPNVLIRDINGYKYCQYDRVYS